jgi:hypothetical protein
MCSPIRRICGGNYRPRDLDALEAKQIEDGRWCDAKTKSPAGRSEFAAGLTSGDQGLLWALLL